MTRDTVWLLESDAAVRHALTFSLTTQGYRVQPFETADALVDVAVPAEALLVVDHRLPRVDGLHVIELLRARGVEAPAVLVTSCAGEDLRARSAQMNIPVVEKPLLNDDLADTLYRLARV